MPQCSLITERTARRTDSASASGSRRRAFGRPLDGGDHGVEDEVVEGLARFVLLGDTDEFDRGIVGKLALLRHGDGDKGAAGEGHAAPLAHRAGLGVLQNRAVLVETARRHLPNDAGIAGAELDEIAVAADQHARHAGGTRELGVLVQVQGLAMDGDQELRPGPGDHVAQFVAAGMTGDMDQLVAVGDDLHALQDQAIDDGPDRLLVAGNGARGEDDAVATVERDLGMVVIGDARQRGTRLALAAGAERQHLVLRQMTVDLGGAETLHAVEIAGLARDLHHAFHGAADHDDLTVGGLRSDGDGLEARDIGGKGRDRDAALGGLDELGDGARNLGFRG
ncbi:hypothetical protein ACVIQY_007239 [Bradyrhizobium sp. USDA 3051]